MAFWDKLSSRGNVEDRRGMGPTAVGGGVGVVGLILYLVIHYAATGRIDTTAILSRTRPTPAPGSIRRSCAASLP